MIALYKKGENIFDQTHQGAMFPMIHSQQMWKYHRGPNYLRLYDNNVGYHFDTVSDHDGDLELKRKSDVGHHEYDKSTEGSKGRAQVHRGDPSGLYFTMQEGTKNPTYTLKHVGGDNWKAILKRKPVKDKPAPPPIEVNEEVFKQALYKEAEEGQGFFRD